MPGGGGFGGMGGPMEFGKSKSKFAEVPETGITFDDVAVSDAHHGARIYFWHLYSELQIREKRCTFT